MIFRDITRNVAGKTRYYAEYFVQYLYLILRYTSYFAVSRKFGLFFGQCKACLVGKFSKSRSLVILGKDRKVFPRVGRFLPLYCQQWSPSLSQQESRAQSSV